MYLVSDIGSVQPIFRALLYWRFCFFQAWYSLYLLAEVSVFVDLLCLVLVAKCRFWLFPFPSPVLPRSPSYFFFVLPLIAIASQVTGWEGELGETLDLQGQVGMDSLQAVEFRRIICTQVGKAIQVSETRPTTVTQKAKRGPLA